MSNLIPREDRERYGEAVLQWAEQVLPHYTPGELQAGHSAPPFAFASGAVRIQIRLACPAQLLGHPRQNAKALRFVLQVIRSLLREAPASYARRFQAIAVNRQQPEGL